MKKWKIASRFLALSLMLAGCGSDEEASTKKKRTYLRRKILKVKQKRVNKLPFIR